MEEALIRKRKLLMVVARVLPKETRALEDKRQRMKTGEMASFSSPRFLRLFLDDSAKVGIQLVTALGQEFAPIW